MPVSTEYTKEDYTRAEPADNEFWDREGLDQKQLRYEFAQPRDLSLDDKYVEREDRQAIDPRTIDLPTSPTGMGEVSNNGMEALRVDGERWDTYRVADGFIMEPEEDETNMARQRRSVMETMSFIYDGWFFRGMDHSSQWNGMAEYVRTAIPSARTLDCENWDGDSTDAGDLTGHEEDLLGVEAFQEADFRLLDWDGGWDMMVGSKYAISKFKGRQGTDAGTSGPSYEERLREDNLVQNFMPLPDKLQITVPPRDSDLSDEDVPSVDLVDANSATGTGSLLGNDEVFLFPEMDTATSEYWGLAEMSTPEYFNSEERMGREAHDYVNRFTAYENPSGEYPNLADCFHLKNVSALFGN